MQLIRCSSPSGPEHPKNSSRPVSGAGGSLLVPITTDMVVAITPHELLQSKAVKVDLTATASILKSQETETNQRERHGRLAAALRWQQTLRRGWEEPREVAVVRALPARPEWCNSKQRPRPRGVDVVLLRRDHVVVGNMAIAKRVYSQSVEKQGRNQNRLHSPHIHIFMDISDGIEEAGSTRGAAPPAMARLAALKNVKEAVQLQRMDQLAEWVTACRTPNVRWAKCRADIAHHVRDRWPCGGEMSQATGGGWARRSSLRTQAWQRNGSPRSRWSGELPSRWRWHGSSWQGSAGSLGAKTPGARPGRRNAGQRARARQSCKVLPSNERADTAAFRPISSTTQKLHWAQHFRKYAVARVKLRRGADTPG